MSRPARSVHLWYDYAEGSPLTSVYNEVQVERSSPGSYFMCIGWSRGYCGIQQREGGRDVVIFSVWDSDEDDPSATPEERRAKCLQCHPGVQVARFGNEGSGGRTLFPFQWELQTRYRFYVTESHVTPSSSRYTCFFDGGSGWLQLATIQCPTGSAGLQGVYSFVEDFGRRGFNQNHRAVFGPCFVFREEGYCESCSVVRFTAAGEEGENIDARPHERGGAFCLETGGNIRCTTALNQSISRDECFDFPLDLPEVDRDNDDVDLGDSEILSTPEFQTRQLIEYLEGTFPK